MDRKTCRKIASKWDQDGERVLLEIWAENINQLRSCRKNSHILLEMASKMEAKGFGYTTEEIKTKMHNLTNRYRKERMKFVSAGGQPSEWELYTALENFLGPYESCSYEGSIVDSIKNINSSIVADPLSPALNNSSSILESTTSPLNPPDSPSSSSGSSDSSSSFPPAKRKKREFDNFFGTLEQTMEKINEDLKTTIERIITIEEEKRDALKMFVDKESEVQEALLEFLRRT